MDKSVLVPYEKYQSMLTRLEPRVSEENSKRDRPNFISSSDSINEHLTSREHRDNAGTSKSAVGKTKTVLKRRKKSSVTKQKTKTKSEAKSSPPRKSTAKNKMITNWISFK